jgi:hypothetical protein
MRIQDLETHPSRKMQGKPHLPIPLHVSNLSSRRLFIKPVHPLLQKLYPNRHQEPDNNMDLCNRRRFMMHPALKRRLVSLIQTTNISKIPTVLFLHHDGQRILQCSPTSKMPVHCLPLCPRAAIILASRNLRRGRLQDQSSLSSDRTRQLDKVLRDMNNLGRRARIPLGHRLYCQYIPRSSRTSPPFLHRKALSLILVRIALISFSLSRRQLRLTRHIDNMGLRAKIMCNRHQYCQHTPRSSQTLQVRIHRRRLSLMTALALDSNTRRSEAGRGGLM